MAHAERCLVCNTSGKVNGKQCHGCEGKGWVTVNDDSKPYYPIFPYTPYVEPFPCTAPVVSYQVTWDGSNTANALFI